MGLSISLTLLAATAIGLALVFSLIQWGTARRRERLSLRWMQGRRLPAYFQEARAARERHSRLMVAALLLLSRECAVLTWALSERSVAFYQVGSGGTLWLQVAGLCLLSYALLYPFYRQKTKLPLLTALATLASAWGLAGALWGWLPAAPSIALARALLIILGIGVFSAWMALPRSVRTASPAALPIWVAGPIFASTEIHQAATAFSYILTAAEVYLEALDRYEEQESTRHRLEREREVILGFLERMGAARQAALDLEEVLRLVVAAGVETTHASVGAIFLLDGRTNTLHMRATHGYFPALSREQSFADVPQNKEEMTPTGLPQQVALGEGVVGQVAATGQAQRIPDAREAGILRGEGTQPGLRQPVLLVPIVFRGEAMGVVVMLNKPEGEEFSEEDQFLLSALAEQAAFTIHNARMVATLAAQERVMQELQIARDIQRLLLPADAPEVPGFDVHALWRPALEMGGDYYDFFWVAEGHLGIVVADVSGKGVPSALTMAMLRSVIRTHALGDLSPGRVIVRVNTTVSKDLPRDTFISILYGILDVRARLFRWVRAGHEPALLLRGDHSEALAPSGTAIGVLHGNGFAHSLETHEVPLSPGDTLVLYTDGISEAVNAEGEEFGMDRFLRALQEGDGDSAQGRARRVEAALSTFVGDAPQRDDFTLVVLCAQ